MSLVLTHVGHSSIDVCPPTRVRDAPDRDTSSVWAFRQPAVYWHVIGSERPSVPPPHSDRRHRHSLVDSAPTTKTHLKCRLDPVLLGPVWSAPVAVLCRPLLAACSPAPWGPVWCHGFRSTIVLWFGSWSESGVFCACSVSRSDCRTAPRGALSAPESVCVCVCVCLCVSRWRVSLKDEADTKELVPPKPD